jgi:hypothetical protein
MNEHGEHRHDVRSEEDRVSTSTILIVGVGSLVTFFVASLATVSFLRFQQGAHPAIAIPAEIGQNKIGMVEQQLFEGTPPRGPRDRTARLERLGSYGWVDQQAGVVHLPIERAMQLVADGVRPATAPAGGAPRGPQP